MKKPVIISITLIILIISGCNPIITPSVTLEPIPTTTQITTQTAIPEPSQTATQIPRLSVTTTRTPKPTPTTIVTSTPAAISQANFMGLHKEAAYELPVRGKLQEAKWSQDGKLILAITDNGTEILSGISLERLHLFPGLIPLTELEGGKWFVRSTGQRRYLNLEGDDYQLLSVENLLDELGLDLISRNREIAVRKTGENEIEVVSLKTGERRVFNYEDAGFYLEYIRPSVISPDGKFLVVEYSNWPDYHVLNLETMEVVYDLGRPYDPIFSPDGQYLLIVDNGGIKVLKARNGIQVNRFSDGFVIRPTPQTYIYYRAMAYDWFPDSQHVGVVYCVEDQKCELYIWSMATGQPETIVKGLPVRTFGLDFAPEGDAFLTVSSDGIVNTWNLETQAVLAESQPYDRAKLVISSDGRMAAVPRGSRVEILDVETGKLLMEVGDYTGAESLMVDSITEKYMVVAGNERSSGAFADLWELTSGEIVRKLKPLDYPNTYSNEAYCMLATAGGLIACGASPLQIFDIDTGALLYSNKSQDGTLVWAISPDGNTLASCTVVYTQDTYEEIPGDRIFLLDLSATPPVISGVLEAPQSGICSPMVFSPDGQYLAAQSGYIWKLDQQELQASFTMKADEPMLFNPNGTLLVSGNHVIQPGTGEVLGELTVNGKVEAIGFDADGYSLAFGTDQGVEVWKVNENWQSGDRPELGSVMISWPAHPAPPVYDDFSGEKFNRNLWKPSLPSGVANYQYNQGEGVLTLQGENPKAMSGLDLLLAQPQRRTINQILAFEARLRIDSLSTGVGFAKIHVYVDAPNEPWWTECRIGNQLAQAKVTFVCDIGVRQNGSFTFMPITDFIEAEFDQWYLIRIDFNPNVDSVQYYLDGELIGSYTPPEQYAISKTFFVPSIGLWTVNSDTVIVASYDDVRISESN